MSTRRKFIKHAALGSIVSSFLPTIASAQVNGADKKRALRIAHITDVHILDQPNAVASFTRVINEINSMKDKPDHQHRRYRQR